MFVGERDLECKIREEYVKNHFLQHYFGKLCNKMKLKTITLLNKLLKWNPLCVYVVKGKLHMKVMQEMHVSMARHHGEKTIKTILSKSLY
jgi:hypothetical protein